MACSCDVRRDKFAYQKRSSVNEVVEDEVLLLGSGGGTLLKLERRVWAPAQKTATKQTSVNLAQDIQEKSVVLTSLRTHGLPMRASNIDWINSRMTQTLVSSTSLPE